MRNPLWSGRADLKIGRSHWILAKLASILSGNTNRVLVFSRRLAY